MRNGKTTEILSSLLWDSHKILWGIFVRVAMSTTPVTLVLEIEVLVMGYVDNTSRSGCRKCKHIFDQYGWVQNWPQQNAITSFDLE